MPEVTPEVPPINTPFFADKSLWVVVLSFILPFIGKKLGVEFNIAEIAGFVATCIAFVAGNKWKTGMLTKEAMAAKASALPPAPVQ